MEPGQSVDYEVDYEEETRRLTRTHGSDLIKKQELVDITFEGHDQRIKKANLKDLDFYHHVLGTDEYVGYGVKIQNMKRYLIIRSPYVINNQTNRAYRIKLLGNHDGTHGEGKLIELGPGQTYPLKPSEIKMLFQIQFAHESTDNILRSKNVWSKAHKVHSIAKKVPLNFTTYVYHGVSYSVIEREEDKKFLKTFNINIKTPLVLTNCLPLTLHLKLPRVDDLDQEEFDAVEIGVGETQYLHCFNLKDPVKFHFTPLNKSPAAQTYSEVAISLSQKDFISEQILKVSQLESHSSHLPAEIVMRCSRDEHAGVRIVLYAPHLLVNNTAIALGYQYDKQKVACGVDAAGFDNIIMLANVSDLNAHSI